ncbi:MAG: hypothetical protein AB2L07_07625 [Thermoanaerobaculaceae bacterium]
MTKGAECPESGGRSGAAPSRAGVLWGIALLSAAALAFEIVLLRVFSFTVWHHFAFMVISIALLGFAVAGVILEVRGRRGAVPTGRAATFALGFAASVLPSVLVVGRLAFDPRTLADHPVQLLRVGAHYLVLLVPFTLAGLGILTLIKEGRAGVGRIYGSDLIGAGAGAAGVATLLGVVGTQRVVLLVVAVAAASAAVVAVACEGRVSTRVMAAALGVGALCGLPWGPRLVTVQPGPTKLMRQISDNRRQYPFARVVGTEWNALARVDIIEGGGVVAWSQNPASPSPGAEQVLLTIDGDASTPMLRLGADTKELVALDYALPSLGAQALRPERVLVIGSGGGIDVLSALRYGARQVDAVEVNPAIVRLVRGPLAEVGGGLFRRPEVVLHTAEGRAFVRGSAERYDHIQLSMIDTWAAAASGAYSLSEAYLYTVEAFEDYLGRLTPGGFVSVTRWEWEPPRELLKVVTVASAALQRRGVERPRDHVVVAMLEDLGTVLLKREPFTPVELASLRRVATARHMEIVCAPEAGADSVYARFLDLRDLGGAAAAYPFDVTPPTDDSPFFFQFGRWRDIASLGRSLRENQLVLSGRLVLLVVLAQATVLSVLLLVVPLLWRRSSSTIGPEVRRGAVLAYFAGIGLAFMLVEVALMQRFTFYLGSPVLAVSVVLATLLVSAGLGSHWSARWGSRQRVGWALPVGIMLVTAAVAWLGPRVFAAAHGLELGGRVAVSLLMLAPVGFLLGAPMPIGLAGLKRHGGALVGWAWAANGCASVIGPVLAAMLAMDLGFTAVLGLGSACYGCSFLVLGRWWTGGEGQRSYASTSGQ